MAARPSEAKDSYKKALETKLDDEYARARKIQIKDQNISQKKIKRRGGINND